MSDHLEAGHSQHDFPGPTTDLEREYARLSRELGELRKELAEQKQREQLLRESEHRFRTMADGTPMIIWVTNADAGIEFVNKAYTDFFNVTAEQIRAIGWQMLVHPDDIHEYVDEYVYCHAQHQPFHAQGRVYRQDGKWRWIESYGQPRFSEDGVYLGMVGSSLDITERVEAEQALRESEKKFHGAFEHAAIGYALQAPDGHFIDANAAYCQIVGHSIEELLKLKFFELVHPEDFDEHIRLVSQLLAGQIADFVVESRYLRKDGQVVWIRKSASLVTYPDGTPKWMLALIEDITERKRVEQALRESEQLYRAIGEAIPYGIWICDPAGRNIYASQSFLDLVGITQEQCSAFGWGDTLHPDDAKRTIQAWQECVRTEGTWDIEHRFLGKDGKFHPILARGVPVRNRQGRIIYWAGINLDISRLKKVEQELKESEEHFQVAIKNSPILVYTCDRELRYTWMYNAPFGITDERVIGKTDEELNGPVASADLIALKRSVVATGVGKREEIQWKYQAGIYYYDVTAEPIRDANGEIAGLTVAAIDISERKHLEQAMHENQVRIELQRRLLEQREQERLAVAQEIHDGPAQTLVSAILELQITKEVLNNPALQEVLNGAGLSIKNAIQELRDIMSELRPPPIQQLGLSAVIRNHAESVHEKCPQLQLTLDLAEDQGTLSNDACLGLFRIYQEALNNLIRHSGATRAYVRLSYTAEMAVLEIEDNGKGMAVSPDLISETEEGRYGLAGMKERAEAVHGEFQIWSAPGQGTKVSVRVPAKRDP